MGGRLFGQEICDDGNQLSGDGCSAQYLQLCSSSNVNTVRHTCRTLLTSALVGFAGQSWLDGDRIHNNNERGQIQQLQGHRRDMDADSKSTARLDTEPSTQCIKPDGYYRAKHCNKSGDRSYSTNLLDSWWWLEVGSSCCSTVVSCSHP